MTRFAAKKESKASAARGDLLVNLNREGKELTENINRQTANEAARINQQHNASRLNEERAKQVAQHEIDMKLADLAKLLNVDVPTLRLIKKN